ncbi:MAG: sigma-70 family RNA polymerase sigma factor [Planctomycetales bacterium]|nr:sigma-70 family RNA polymerase sigma factor [Planctomycetales bacterium]
MDHEPTSTSLVLLLREQSPAGWRRFTEQYSPIIYGWCRMRRLDEAAAGDVAQEVFLSVVRSIAGFRKERQEDTLRGWLWMITQNKIRDHFRRLARAEQAAGGSTAQLMLAQIANDESLTACDIRTGHDAELAKALETIQSEVQPSTWSAFWRTTIDGVDSATIAEELGISTGAARVNRFRVLKRLRELLTPYALDQAGLN